MIRTSWAHGDADGHDVMLADPSSQSASPTPAVSIIIPVHRWNERSARAVAGCLELQERSSVEVIVVSDQQIDNLPSACRVVVTGANRDSSPAIKRDLGRSIARGKFLAYIDDDAFPEPGWIDHALAAISALDVDGVGGPGLTPTDSTWRERLSGSVYGSILGSGPLRHRFVIHGYARLVDELPAYNFVVKRECMDEVGGWDSSFYGGEDTAVCSRLRSRGFKLAYTPDAIVYHHRRAALTAHLRQIGNVGRHRGYFVRRRDPSSLRGLYFVPALLLLCFPVVAAFFVVAAIREPAITLTSLAILWMLLAGLAVRDIPMWALFFPGVLLTHHLWYGLNFVFGLCSSSLDDGRDSGIPGTVVAEGGGSRSRRSA